MNQSWFVYLGLILVVWMGAILPMLIKKGDLFFTRLLLFSGSYLLGIAIIHFIPDIITNSPAKTPWILVGFFLQIIIQKFSSGSEHGHIHNVNLLNKGIAFQVLIGLSFHTLMDGISVGSYTAWSHQHHEIEKNGLGFILGILVHKIGEGFSLASLFVLAKSKPWESSLTLLIFSLIAPISAWIVSGITISPAILSIVMALVAGSFLHISASILLENKNKLKEKGVDYTEWLVIFMGFSLAIFTSHH